MKKVTISLVLVLVMMTIISLPALADNNTIGMIVYNGQQGGKILYEGKEVGKVYDNRVTITCGEIHFPETEVGYYNQEQLDFLAKTWTEFKIVPNGMLPLVFAGGLKLMNNTYDEGVAAYIGRNDQTIRIRNGELVLWSHFEDMHDDIKNRMAIQIEKGNLDIHAPLAFKACSPEVAGYFPAELLVNNKVKIIDP